MASPSVNQPPVGNQLPHVVPSSSEVGSIVPKKSELSSVIEKNAENIQKIVTKVVDVVAFKEETTKILKSSRECIDSLFVKAQDDPSKENLSELDGAIEKYAETLTGLIEFVRAKVQKLERQT